MRIESRSDVRERLETLGVSPRRSEWERKVGPAIFIISILGCGDDNAPCQTIAVMPQQYASVMTCQSGAEDAIQHHLDSEYPVLVAQCLRSDSPMPIGVSGDEVKLPRAVEPKRGTRIRSGQLAQG